MLKLLRFIALLSCFMPAARAQGYEVIPWSAGKPTPAFAGVDLEGRLWRLTDLRGKAVLVNFWASWCEPCRDEMPSLQSLAQKWGPKRLVVLAVNFKESTVTAARYVQDAQLALPVLRDSDGSFARAWGVNVFPSTVLIDSTGRARQQVRGEIDGAGPQAAQLVAPLLAQPGSKMLASALR